jgi:hypothetical protein
MTSSPGCVNAHVEGWPEGRCHCSVLLVAIEDVMRNGNESISVLSVSIYMVIYESK